MAGDLDVAIRRDLDRRRDQLVNIHDPYTAIAFEGMQSAILTVLAIHKPLVLGSDKTICLECSSTESVAGEVRAPCRTVRAIVKKLGIEVEDA